MGKVTPIEHKYCVNCKHHREGIRSYGQLHLCGADVYEGINLVTGIRETKGHLIACEVAREENMPCGIPGHKFEWKD